MTAEVALLNKHGVALAADSAVTFTSLEGQKIYNAGNKLFALSKYHPVGVMVYGNAEYMGIPWETIVKLYRQRLADRSFSKLEEYFADFRQFLGSDDDLFGDETQGRHVVQNVGKVFSLALDEIEEKIESVIDTDGSIDEARIGTIATEVIAEYHDPLGTWDYAVGMDAAFEDEVAVRYRQQIEDTISAVFERLPLTDENRASLHRVATRLLTRDNFGPGTSGLVVAGFGSAEVFPSLRSATVEARIAGRLREKLERWVAVGFGDGQTESAIVPFAQVDAVTLFVEGIDPAYAKLAYGYVRETLRGFPEAVIDGLGLDDTLKAKLREELEKRSEEVFKEFAKRAGEARRKRYVVPLLNVVAALPKDELAAVAEALVNLTSLRRKVSMDAETVGGPIDVAVISKGDGLVWIRRKHYFKPDLNPYFFQNYFRPTAIDCTDDA